MRNPRLNRRRIGAGATLLIAGICPFAALAQSDSGDIWTRSALLGTIGGLRTDLGNYGVTLNVTDSENLLGNLLGGVKQGATLQGVTTAVMEIDTAKAFGWQGGTFHVSALQVHGRSLSPYYLDDLQTANGNEAEDDTRLWELWYDQAFDYNRADFKIGQQSIDNEFITSKYSALFVNTMAGWPLVPSYDLYGGGPAYPLSSLGARIQFKPADNQNLLAGVFDDNPGGGSFTQDAQALDASGTRFNLNTGALFIAEYQVNINQPAVGQMVQSASPPQGLPGTYKLGFWYDTGSFPDQEYSNDGLSLANPASDGIPLDHHGNFSIYAVMDQTIWQSQSDSSRSLNIFARVMGAPNAQNLIDFSFSGGFTVDAPLPGRDNDQFGINVGVGKTSTAKDALDAAQGLPKQSTEELIEATYQVAVTGWLTFQPDFQYVVNPGAGVQDPDDPQETLRNEFVAGARMVTTF